MKVFTWGKSSFHLIAVTAVPSYLPVTRPVLHCAKVSRKTSGSLRWLTGNDMNEKKSPVSLNEDICVHVFTASEAMVGVCITVIGIFQVVTTLRSEDSLGDDFLAINAILYLITTLLSYWALRTSNVNRNHFLEKLVDILFLIALTCTTAIAGFITWAITVH
jgi:hypothetical protein